MHESILLSIIIVSRKKYVEFSSEEKECHRKKAPITDAKSLNDDKLHIFIGICTHLYIVIVVLVFNQTDW